MRKLVAHPVQKSRYVLRLVQGHGATHAGHAGTPFQILVGYPARRFPEQWERLLTVAAAGQIHSTLGRCSGDFRAFCAMPAVAIRKAQDMAYCITPW